MHTTSFDHKYQVGEEVWVIDSEPTMKVISSVYLDHNDKLCYRFGKNYSTPEDYVYPSLMDAQEAFVEAKKKRIKWQLESAQERFERESKFIKEATLELSELEN